jgi:glycosyltransferase involved in cell wall biosynthesis
MFKKKIVFLSNHAAFFCSHRLNLFFEAKKRGFDFHLIFGSGSSKIMEKNALSKIKKLKIQHSRFNFNANYGFIKNFIALIKIFFFIRRYRPDILHSASPFANFFATIIAIFYYKTKLVLSVSGMGYLYTANLSIIEKFKKKIFEIFFIIFLKKINYKAIIVQNKNDYNYFNKILKLNFSNIFLIKGGSGVDPRYFKKIKIIKNNRNVLMLSRIVRSKGVCEYLEAAKILKKKYPDWNFNLVGPIDYSTPDKIDLNYFNYFLRNKIINYLGYAKDSLVFYKKAEIFCLPSYREGMPKTVLEASAVGLPIITTNVVGCKESIVINKNGLLCKKKNYKDLSKKLEILIKDRKLRNRMKVFSKIYAYKYYRVNKVTETIFGLYEK